MKRKSGTATAIFGRLFGFFIVPEEAFFVFSERRTHTMGWDDLIDLGLDLAGGLFDHDDTRTRGFDALVVSRREDQGKSIRRGRYLLHLARFTGETG